MAKVQKRTYKHIKPVLIKDKHFLEVYRKDPKTQKTVYLQRQDSVEQCCKALRKRFPKEAALFSPTLLELKKKKKRKPPKRIEKIKYTGATPIVLDDGKTIWQVQKKFETDSWNYDTQIEAACAVAKSEGVTLEEIKHEKPRLPILARHKLRAIHGPAMNLYRKRKPADLENLEAHAKRPRTWKSLKQYPGILPSFLIAKVAADRDNVVDSCVVVASKIKKNQLFSQRAGEEYQHYSILVAAAKQICRHR